MKAAFLIGRLVFGGFFLYNGINHLKQYKNLSQYAGLKNVPMPEQAVTASTVLLLLGGASILLGAKPKIGTAAIIAFLAAVSPMIHDFWKQQDPSQRQNELVNFTKNMALLGAAIALMGIEEPWPASVPLVK
jgi:uncharacterized membrane protein YphA (DoxX/SURF4 family)